MRRWWSIGTAGFFGLCVLTCLAVVVIGLPEFRGNLKKSVQHAVATEVARQIPAPPGQVAQPGTYVITAASLQERLQANAGNSGDAENVFVTITTTGIEFGISSRGQNATYRGMPAVEDGRFVIRDFDTTNRFLSFIIPADDLAKAVEGAVNTYLQMNNLQVQAVDLTNGEMTLTTVAAP